MNTENRPEWRAVDGEYQHVNGQWQIVPAWTGKGVELFERVPSPPFPWKWSVVLAFDSPDEAAAYVRGSVALVAH